METKNIKVLFSDIGGVLLSNGWGHESREKAAKKFNLDYTEINRLHEFIFNVYEIGSISLDEYLDIVIFNHEREFTKQDFKSFMFNESTELPGMLQWLIQWKKSANSIRTISINNEGKELNDYRIKKFKLHRCFDAFISSCDVRLRKPDPGIFKMAMGIAHASAAQCYYFDDRPMIVETARSLGMNAFLHKDFETTKEIIEKL
jgi:putative hydrolase of the HAD superfamily